MINDFIQHGFSVMANNIWLVVSESLWLCIPIGVMAVAIFALAGTRSKVANITSLRNASLLGAPREKPRHTRTIRLLPSVPDDSPLESREIYIDLAHVSITPMSYRINREASRRCYRKHHRSN